MGGEILPWGGSAATGVTFPQSAHGQDGVVVALWHPLPQDPLAPLAMGLRGLQSDPLGWYHRHQPPGCRVLSHEPTLWFVSAEVGLGPTAPFPRAGSPSCRQQGGVGTAGCNVVLPPLKGAGQHLGAGVQTCPADRHQAVAVHGEQ